MYILRGISYKYLTLYTLNKLKLRDETFLTIIISQLVCFHLFFFVRQFINGPLNNTKPKTKCFQSIAHNIKITKDINLILYVINESIKDKKY